MHFVQTPKILFSQISCCTQRMNTVTFSGPGQYAAWCYHRIDCSAMPSRRPSPATSSNQAHSMLRYPPPDTHITERPRAASGRSCFTLALWVRRISSPRARDPTTSTMTANSVFRSISGRPNYFILWRWHCWKKKGFVGNNGDCGNI